MDSPVTVIMKCDVVQPVGVEIVRAFDINYCIVAIKVFLVLFDGDTYGTTAFENLNDYWQYVGTECKCCPTLCVLTIGNCNLTIGGCNTILTINN
jgi:hypothetical protein